MASGPQPALDLLQGLLADPMMKNYHLLPSVHGDSLSRLGRHSEASAEFQRAASLTRNRRNRIFSWNEREPANRSLLDLPRLAAVDVSRIISSHQRARFDTLRRIRALHVTSTFPDRSQPVHNRPHNNLLSLVEDRRSRADEAKIRAAGEAASFKNFGQGAKPVVWSYRMRPAHFLNACSDHSSADIDRFDPKSHHDSRSEPSRSGK